MIGVADGDCADRIAGIYQDRRRDRGPLLEKMRAVTQVYNSDVAFPLPELSSQSSATVSNITQQGLDQMAMRIASVMPNLTVPSVRPGFDKHDDAARDRQRAWLGMWQENRVQKILRRRSRWFLGYSQAPVAIRPNFTLGRAQWHPRSPLLTYPAHTTDPDDMRPSDAITVATCRYADLKRRYPDQAWWLAGRYSPNVIGDDMSPDQPVDLVQWEDADERILIATIRDLHGRSPYDGADAPAHACGVLLERVPNRVGECTVVVPGRITLDKLVGAFDGIVGMYHTMTELTALAVLASKKGILGEKWLVARANEQPKIIQAADPTQGLPGIVEGAEFQNVPTDPAWATFQTVAHLERASRESAGIPADLTGTSGQNIRTGRRGDQLLSATIDFPIQEAQELFAESLSHENHLAALTEKAYFGSARRSFYVSWPKADGHIDYTPAELWTNTVNYPTYAMAGADSMSLNIELSQRVGAGTMAKRTAMELDPLVRDVDNEHARIISGALEDAFLSSIQTQAADPASPYQPADMARIIELVEQGKKLTEAVLTVQREAQERQATPTEDLAAQQPGLSLPGMGAEAPPAIAGPNTSQQNLASLLRSTTTTGYTL